MYVVKRPCCYFQVFAEAKKADECFSKSDFHKLCFLNLSSKPNWTNYPFKSKWKKPRDWLKRTIRIGWLRSWRCCSSKKRKMETSEYNEAQRKLRGKRKKKSVSSLMRRWMKLRSWTWTQKEVKRWKEISEEANGTLRKEDGVIKKTRMRNQWDQNLTEGIERQKIEREKTWKPEHEETENSKKLRKSDRRKIQRREEIEGRKPRKGKISKIPISFSLCPLLSVEPLCTSQSPLKSNNNFFALFKIAINHY